LTFLLVSYKLLAGRGLYRLRAAIVCQPVSALRLAVPARFTAAAALRRGQNFVLYKRIFLAVFGTFEIQD
jgi:hypothetical protein